MDSYLKIQARQEIKRKVTACYVLTDRDEGTIIGYYTLSSTSIELESLPAPVAKKHPKYPLVPAILLGRLAIRVGSQGKGYGEYLLMDALNRSWEHSDKIGAAAVIVEAINENAAHFYQRYDFFQFPDQKSLLFIPMETIRNLIKAS